MEIPDGIHVSFIEGLATTAYGQSYNLQSVRKLDDGFVEVVFSRKGEPEIELSFDFRYCEDMFHGRPMMEVRLPRVNDMPSMNIFVSPIPFAVFGAVYCET